MKEPKYDILRVLLTFIAPLEPAFPNIYFSINAIYFPPTFSLVLAITPATQGLDYTPYLSARVVVAQSLWNKVHCILIFCNLLTSDLEGKSFGGTPMHFTSCFDNTF